MPKFVVRQPSNALAIFSTVVDDFVMSDMTTEEAREEISDPQVQRGIDDEELSGGPPGMLAEWDTYRESKLRRWHFCLSEILRCHGYERLKVVLDEIK